MTRLAVAVCGLVGVLALPGVGLAAPSRSAPAAPRARSASSQPAGGHVSGTLIGVDRRTFAIQASGRRMSMVRALSSAADAVTAGDYPYVYGGGHAQAGVASIGLKGPGYNGRRIGFDCSGSVAAVLSEAGLWPVAGGVPSDAGVISELLREHLIARGRGRGASQVTFYDDAGVHIFMEIDGRFFGTSDGAGGGNPNGGAGWLDDGAPDTFSRHYKPYHLLAGVVREQTTFARVFTFQTPGRGRPSIMQGLELGSVVHVAYTVAPDGRAVAQSVG